MKSKKSQIVAIFLVICVPLVIQGWSQIIPKPEEVLGFEVGADYHLAAYEQAIEYFKKLEENSDRIKLFEAGKTSMGKTMTYAVISNPENLKNLESYQKIMRDLSLVKNLSEEEALNLSQKGKAIVYIDGGLHASGCAPAQHNIQLAYNLVSATDSKSLRILNDVILVLVFANPDGMDLLAEWYHPNVGTPYEVSPMPWLYHIYSGHDNNRDSYIANLKETQNISKLIHKQWYPVILYNHHQTAPFPARIWIPPNSEPTNPNVHPLIVRWQNLIGSAMGAAFDEEGKEGAISRIVFDTWYPGYMTQVVDSHNIVSILTETALYRYATPHFYTIRDFPKEYQDLTMSAFYPNPWRGGWWRLKDAVDYCLTASMAVLDTASKYRAELLFGKYRMGRDAIQKFSKEPPFAWIIPEKQKDPGAASLLLNRMILLGVDVFRSTESFLCDGISYPPGTFLIPMNQPFSYFVKNVFEVQTYPDLRKYPDLWQGLIRPKTFEGAPFESYDMMGWTLPFQFGIQVYAANSPVTPAMKAENEVRFQKGEISGKPGYAYLLSPSENSSFTAINRILKNNGKVFVSKEPFSTKQDEIKQGAFIVPSKTISETLMKGLAESLDLKMNGIPEKPPVPLTALKSPRLGIYQSWVPIPSSDEGWTRYVLDQHEFSYTVLHDSEIRAGNLVDNFEVIILPGTYRPEIIIKGHAKGTLPAKYGEGITLQGLKNLKTFAKEGGTLVFLNSTCNLAADHFGIPVRNVLKNVEREKFVCDGSLLRAEFDTQHPLAFGMPKESAIVFSDSCAFELLPSFEGNKEPRSASRFPRENLLMSGWIYGENLIKQKSSILEVPYEKGTLILLGFPVQFRAQPYATFKLLFNAIFFGGMAK